LRRGGALLVGGSIVSIEVWGGALLVGGSISGGALIEERRYVHHVGRK